jgi:mono/diheme cytochrome c family protein
MKKPLLFAVAVLVALIAIPLVVVWAGAVNVAADTPHGSTIFKLLETARERSIAVRTRGIQVPQLSDPEAVRRGAGNYDSMCRECHLAPGATDTELSLGLYPAPPNLSRGDPTDPARAYWIIKHGIKATGMPAWGKSMEDHYIWDMVALLQVLPQMSAEQYANEVIESGGHSHGGSETVEHSHEDSNSMERPHDETDPHSDQAASDTATRVHTHKDGSKHEH